MQARGKMLNEFIDAPDPADHSHETDPTLQTAMQQLLGEKNFTDKSIPKVFINRKKKEGRHPHAVKFHVFSESTEQGITPQRKILVVKEKNNQILGYREYVSR